MAIPKIREQIEARVQDTGDTMTGRLVQTLNGNPYYELNDGTNRWFFQAIKADNASYIGPTSTKALKIDADGNATVKGNLTVSGSIIGSIQEAVKATQDGNGATITSTYLKLSGGTMTGNIYFPNNRGIIQNQDTTSNYTNAITWLQGGVSENSYDPQIGHHNTGDTNGAIVLLPYSTSNSPWSGTDGLYIGSTNLKYNGNIILNASNYNSYAPTKTGGGASGTWGISISGNAATATTATKATQDGDGNPISSTYLKLSGGTMTGYLTLGNASTTSTIPAAGIRIPDLRDCTPTPGMFGERVFNIYFDQSAASGDWQSIMHIKGWTGAYVAYELAGPASTGNYNQGLYYRAGVSGTWQCGWKKLWMSGDSITVPSGTDYTTYRARNIASNTSALTSGSTALTNGYIYLQYK